MSGVNLGVCPITIILVGEIQPHRFVGTNNQRAGAGVNALGVAGYYGKDEPTTIDTLGVVSVEVGAAVAAGALLESDAQGRAITRTTGAILARTLDAATAAGQRVRAILIPN